MCDQSSSSRPTARPRAERVWVIGLDGATFQVLDAFSRHGWMPNLVRLAHSGVTASLRSTLPPVSAPAWTSFLTGCSPGQHGIYSFRGPMRNDFSRAFINATSIRAPRIWQYLELFDLSTGLINVPMTFPVEPLDGYMVAGMLTPDGKTAVAYPEAVQQTLRSEDYVVDLHIGRHEREIHTEEQVIGLADDLVSIVRKRTQSALQLLEQRPTDFFTLVFTATDRIQHYAWQYIDRLVQDPEAAQSDRVCQRVLALYQELDSTLGIITDLADDKTTLIVMSDHGFCHLHTRVHLNEWLAQQGWLHSRQGAKAVRRLSKRKRGWLRRLLPRQLLQWGRRSLSVSHTLDWKRTLAYAGDIAETAIYINVKDREPQGIVPDGEPYSSLRSKVRATLVQLIDPDRNTPAVKHVYEREEIYSGEHLELAPDIVFEPAEGYEMTPEIAYEGSTFVDVRDKGRGIHAQSGILIMAGPGAQQQSTRGQAEIIDLAPTALYLLGLPVPSEMDGRVLEETLEPHWLSARPPQQAPLADRVSAQHNGTEDTSTTRDRRLVEQRLKDLGYLD